MNIKLRIFLIIPAFLFFVEASNAQGFLTQNKIWNNYYYTSQYNLYDKNGNFLGWTSAKITTLYKVGADSLIDGTIYKQILYSEDSTMENWHFSTLMWEEGDKVFIGKSESPLYDFGMQPGDTLFDNDGYVATVLETVRDTVMDKTRKLYIFSKYMYDSSLQGYNDFLKVEETWIEGIGALRGGLFRPLSDFMTGGPEEYYIGYYGLICYSENGELVYHNPNFDKCYYHEICSLPCYSYIPEVKAEMGILTQNAPNPFTNQTEIKYFVANGVKAAYICIFDMQGKMLKKINAAAGQNNVMIQGSTLQAGMYLYSLIVDGQEVDTKRMILTK